ncbi:asparagine-tRNA ligase [Verruconis gallopava]|uniref:asparagine--tRNA ligase n=1 Tax=Verruconis gallopava TaxID=253628 RepID=A0A0D2A7Q4_9PEZI|nr:asparagine-tRNA ligase [Verruconis gallopava]KIW02798.1 asparagine-tRNA ligase [Verruconis gallopava]
MLRPLQHVGCRGVAQHQGAYLLTRRHISTTTPATTVAQLLRSTAEASSSLSTQGPVTLNGFVRTVRKQKRVAFAAIGDGTSLDAVQAVLTPDQGKDLSTGAAVQISGQWQKSPSGKEQSHELVASEVTLLGDNDAESYPIQKKYHSADFLRTLPHLRTRIPFNALLLRLRSESIRHATEYFTKLDYVQTHPPIITSSDCEGAGEVFHVRDNAVSTTREEKEGKEFFRSQKYLTVSSQLHLEALAQSVGRVWTLSPTFRAEHSDTPRHLSEFYMLEAEACFVDDVNAIMDVVEGLIRAIVNGLQSSTTGEQLLSASAKKHLDDHQETKAADIEARWNGIIGKPWPRITYFDAIERLQAAMADEGVSFEHSPCLGAGLQAEHEKFIAETVGQGSPVFITDYPGDIKAFYMAPSITQQNPDISTVACFDLLVPELCEIVGGSMREHRLEHLLRSMEAHRLLDPNSAFSTDLQSSIPTALQWYVDLRRYGSVPHGGFGLGFDRLLCYLSGVSSIRDVVSFPRWYGRCDC